MDKEQLLDYIAFIRGRLCIAENAIYDEDRVKAGEHINVAREYCEKITSELNKMPASPQVS